MNTMPEMKTVWVGMVPNVTKSFGDEWDQEGTKVRRWVTGIGPQHPKDFVAWLVHQESKPKASGQRCLGHVGFLQEGNLVDEADEKSESQ